MESWEELREVTVPFQVNLTSTVGGGRREVEEIRITWVCNHQCTPNMKDNGSFGRNL